MKDLSFAIFLSLHQLTRSQFADKLKQLLTVNPAVDFSRLEAGQTYLSLGYDDWRGAQVFSVHAVSVKRTQATVSRPISTGGTPGQFKLYFGSYRSSRFHRLDDATQTLIGVTHEEIIRSALARKLDIPPRVRREYPALFLDCPPRYSAEEFVKLVEPNWGRVTGPEELDRLIADKGTEIHRLTAERNAAVALCHESVKDYDEYLHTARRACELARWLKPHVSPGGIFYVEN
jgi:hypothetical protein